MSFAIDIRAYNIVQTGQVVSVFSHLPAGGNSIDQIIPFSTPDQGAEGFVVVNWGPVRPIRLDGNNTNSPVLGLHFPKMLRLSLGRWQPVIPDLTKDVNDPENLVQVDEYVGDWDANGQFVRVDIVFDDLINPAGPLENQYTPMLFGSKPAYGFIELDIDNNVMTGGDYLNTAFKYNANIARFGGVPVGSRFENRIALDGQTQLDNPFGIPSVYASGEDLHIKLSGEVYDIVKIHDVVNNETLCENNSCMSGIAGQFSSDSVWDVYGYFLDAAEGYNDFILSGSYKPLVRLRYQYSNENNVTLVSLIFPLTQQGWAQANLPVGFQPQDIPSVDFNNDNAMSVEEFIFNLQQSAAFGVGGASSYYHLIQPWACNHNNAILQCQDSIDANLNPAEWHATAIIETVLPSAPNDFDAGLFIITDVIPPVVNGDFNGDGIATRSDSNEIAQFILNNDGNPQVDGTNPNTADGSVGIIDFGPNFFIYDLNYDGIVDQFDVSIISQDYGDYDNDNDIDMRDLAAFQRCNAMNTAGFIDNDIVACFDAFDIDQNNVINNQDFNLIMSQTGMTGPN